MQVSDLMSFLVQTGFDGYPNPKIGGGQEGPENSTSFFNEACDELGVSIFLMQLYYIFVYINFKLIISLVYGIFCFLFVFRILDRSSSFSCRIFARKRGRGRK